MTIVIPSSNKGAVNAEWAEKHNRSLFSLFVKKATASADGDKIGKKEKMAMMKEMMDEL